MTLYFTNFDDSDIDTDPPVGFTKRVAGATYTHQVEYGTPLFKRRVCRLTSATGVGSEIDAISLDVVDNDANRANVEFLICARKPTASALDRVHVIARGQGAQLANLTDGYQISIDWTAGIVRVYKIVASVVTHPFADLVITDGAGLDFLYRIRVNGGATTTIQVKHWQVAPESSRVAEPAAWDLTITDNTSPITAAGFVAFGGFGSASGKSADFNYLSTATNGDTARIPLQNTDFSAWLASVAQRCVLAELTTVGYDATVTPYTVPITQYISNFGFTSQPWDQPANQLYSPWISKTPTLSRQMTTALSGKASSSFGELRVSNPKGADGAGVRVDWLRMKWRKDFVRIYYGDPSWPRHDFRPFLIGRLGQPTATESDIVFPIFDLLEKLSDPFQKNLLGTNNNSTDNKPKPVLIGKLAGGPDDSNIFAAYGKGGFVDPVSTIPKNVFQLHDGACKVPDVYDNFVSLTSSPGTVSSVSGNTITCSANHGFVAGYRVRFSGSAAPTPLANSTDSIPDNPTIYYVIAAGLTATAFRLSATKGGTEITLTNTATGATINGYGWDNVAGVITLATNPVGRVLCMGASQNDGRTQAVGAAGNIDWALFTKYGLSKNFRDPTVFTTWNITDLAKHGVWFGPTLVTALQALDRLTSGWNGWYGFTADGLFQIGRLDLPAATAVMSLTESDVQLDSLQLVRRRLPLDFSQCPVTYSPSFYTAGTPQVADSTFNVDRWTLAPLTNSAAAVPIDNVVQGDTEPARTFALDLWGNKIAGFADPGPVDEQTRLKALFAKSLGTFEFLTRLKAIELNIGDTLQLAHSRLGWKQWTASDPSSPDNTNTIDSRLGVVIGMDVDLSATDPVGVVKLSVIRQLPGYFPVPLDSQFNFILAEDGTYILQEDNASKIRKEYASA